MTRLLRWTTVAIVCVLAVATTTAAQRRGGGPAQGAARPTIAVARALSPSVRASLRKLLRGLPVADVALVEQALATRPRARVKRTVARLEALPGPQRTAMVTSLDNALAPLNLTQRRAVIDGLLGTAGGRELTTLNELAAGAEQNILVLFHQDLDALPAYLADGGDQGAVGFIDQTFALMQGNLQALLDQALGEVPAGARALLMQADLAGTAALPSRVGGPGAAGLLLLFLQSAPAEQFVAQSAYQAGYDCGLGECTPTGEFVIEVSGVHVMPELIQANLVDCSYSPVCTQPQYQGLIAWIHDQVASTEEQQALVNAVTSEYRADSAQSSEDWIQIYECVAQPACEAP